MTIRRPWLILVLADVVEVMANCSGLPTSQR